MKQSRFYVVVTFDGGRLGEPSTPPGVSSFYRRAHLYTRGEALKKARTFKGVIVSQAKWREYKQLVARESQLLNIARRRERTHTEHRELQAVQRRRSDIWQNRMFAKVTSL